MNLPEWLLLVAVLLVPAVSLVGWWSRRHRHEMVRLYGIEDYTIHECACGATRGWPSGEKPDRWKRPRR